MEGSKYTNEDRYKAVCIWSVTGSDVKAADILGIPRSTVRQWRAESSWWPEMLETVQQEKGEEFTAKLSGFIDLALERLLGNIDKIPLEKLMVNFGIAYDKWRIQQSLPTSITGKANETERLEELAERITELSKQNRKANANPKPPEIPKGRTLQ